MRLAHAVARRRRLAAGDGETDGLRIHLLHGAEGLTLAYYERDQDNCWVAYAARRKQGRATPEEFALAADDEGRTAPHGIRPRRRHVRVAVPRRAK